ncbi:MAG: hypothetical protein LBC62_11015 [Treponema sp.]|jgi:hypothetical protein|nr:hypothetical protein [Treponema sp.]
MRKCGWLTGWLSLILVSAVLASCRNPAGGADNPGNPPIDPAFWYGEIHEQLIANIGEISSDGYPEITDSNGVNGEQIVSSKYVCDAINEKYGTALSPASGTEKKPANCEYLLKTIDIANGNSTQYSSSSYATKQVVDTDAVTNALKSVYNLVDGFIAGGGSGVYQSAEGIDWTSLSASGNSFIDVAYGNGMYVGISPNKVYYSSDCITWADAGITGINGNFLSCFYAQEKFVIVGISSIFHSMDGTNWSVANVYPIWPSDAYYIWGITYAFDKFVAAGGGRIAYSSNGVSWSPGQPQLPFQVSGGGIAYGNGRLVAVGGDGMARSTDGINWTVFTPPFNTGYDRNFIVYGNGRFIMSTREKTLAYSTDGISWTATTTEFDPVDLLYADGKFIAIFSDGIYYSPDGLDWKRAFPATGLSTSLSWIVCKP